MDGKDAIFDPYHKWLAIPKGQRPPTLYQILGLSQGETDAEVIEEAAIRQTTHVRAYQIGPHAEVCTKILNEIAQARQILSNPAKRQAYDQKLAAKSGTNPLQKAVAPPVVARPVPPPVPAVGAADNPFAQFEVDTAVSATPTAHSVSSQRKPARPAAKLPASALAESPPPAPKNMGLLIGGGIAAVVVVGALIGGGIWMAMGDGTSVENPNPSTIAKRPVKVDPPIDPQPKPPIDPQPKPPVDPQPKPPIDPHPKPPVVSGVMPGGIPIEAPYVTDAPELRSLIAYSTDVPTSNLVPLPGNRLFTGTGPEFRIVDPYRGSPRMKPSLNLLPDSVAAGQANGEWLVIYKPGDAAVSRYNVNSGEVLALGDAAAEKRGGVISHAVSPRLPLAAVGTNNGEVAILNLATARTEKAFRPPLGEIRAIAAANNLPVFAFIGSEGWGLYSQFQPAKPVTSAPLPKATLPDPVSAVMTPNGDTVIVSASGGLYAANVNAPDQWKRIQQVPGSLKMLTFSPDGRYLAALGPSGILVWDWRLHQLVRKSNLLDVKAMAFSPDGNYLFVSSGDSGLRTYSVDGRDLPPSALLPDPSVKVDPPKKETPKVDKIKPPPAVAKLDPPGADKLPELQKLIHEQFAKEYAAAKKTSADRAALASKLLKIGQETTDDAAARYVLLAEARDNAAQAGRWSIAEEALDALSDGYKVDALAQRETAMQTALKAPVIAKDDAEEIALAAMGSLTECMAGDRIETAQAFVVAGAAAASKAKSPALAAQFKKHEQEMKSVAAEFERYKKAQETLGKSPDDPDANLDAGRYVALRKGEWDKGLVLLAKSVPGELRDAARKDVENPTDVKKQQETGDAWWGIAEKEKDSAWLRSAYLNRAAHWYRAAADKATGLTLTVLNDRLKVIDDAPSPFHADTSSAANSRVFRGHKGAVTSLMLAPDRKSFYTGSLDGTIRTWELASGKNTATLNAAAPVISFAISPNERFLHTISKDGVRVFQIAKTLTLVGKSTEPVGGAFWFGPASLFWTRASGGAEYHYYPGGSGNTLPNFPVKGPNLAGDSVRNRYITLGDDVRLFRSPTLQNQAGVKLPVSDATCAIYHPDGLTALIGCSDRSVRQLDLNQNKVLATFDNLPEVPRSLALSENSKRLAIGGEKKGVYLWNVDTSKEIGRMTQHTGPVNAVAFSADNSQLLSASNDGTIRVWSLPRDKK